VTRYISFVLAAGVLIAGFTTGPSQAAGDPAGKGKSCRMEQQCRWENFKKICTYVKVCR
jgi:hypothetical protein